MTLTFLKRSCHFPSIVSIKSLLLITTAALLIFTNIVHATDNDNLVTQQQFRQDLDTWMMRAYEGDKEAQFKVGVLFTNDQFRKPDYQQAVYWYKQAARQGHVLAQYNLGHQYLTGIGIQKSEKQAMQWWLKAAKQGHALSQFNIGRAYYLGIGLDKDVENSKYWFRQAAKNNEPKSIDILNKLGWNQSNTSENLEVTKEIKPIKKTTKTEKKPQQTTSTKTTHNKTKQSTISAKAEQHLVINQPLALYTNPSKRSVLIAIQDSDHKIEIIKRDKKWTSVRIANGFPVWVHSNFVKKGNDYVTITGSAVNARAAPIITEGTIVGKLNKREKLLIIDNQRDWYRVISPAYFKAWVKTQNLEKLSKPIIIKTAKASDKTELSSNIKSPISPQSDIQNVSEDKWLFDQPSENYTLQIGNLDSQEKISSSLLQSTLLDQKKLKPFTIRGKKDTKWTYFLYGSYSKPEEAEAVRKSIPQNNVWVRNFAELTQNRCLAWKTQIPSPKELNQYCKD